MSVYAKYQTISLNTISRNIYLFLGSYFIREKQIRVPKTTWFDEVPKKVRGKKLFPIVIVELNDKMNKKFFEIININYCY